MSVWTTVTTIAGAALSVAAAVWLLVGFDPMKPRYRVVEGGGYGQEPDRPTGVRLLLKDQSKAAGLAVSGATLQLLGVLLSLLR